MGTLVVTGAGISLASGIPTFRGSDPGAVWTKDTTDKGTLAFFHRNPVASWQWNLDKLLKYRDAQPNDAHRAIAEWEKKLPPGEFLLVTQNIDNLHEKAGSKNIIHIHGSADKVRCSRKGCKNGAPYGTMTRFDPKPVQWMDGEGNPVETPEKYKDWVRRPRESEADFRAFEKEPSFQNLPRCSICHALIRPHMLWFDESYSDHADYRWDELCDFAENKAKDVWFIGTSMAVGVTDMLLSIARESGARVRAVNPTEEFVGALGDDHIRQYAEVWLPEYVRSL